MGSDIGIVLDNYVWGHGNLDLAIFLGKNFSTWLLGV